MTKKKSSERRKNIGLPSFDQFFIPLLQALIELGGSGTIEEINQKVYIISDLSEEQLQIPHGKDGRTEIDYRLAWTRTYLKGAGYLENSNRGVWALIKSDLDIAEIKYDNIVKSYRDKFRKETGTEGLNLSTEQGSNNNLVSQENSEDWKDLLLNRLYKIPPSGFERLSQRILRESGFIQVEVTGKVGDGGIDGKGIVRLNGFLSFHVIFQCKRYQGSVTPSQIRDFRGAMQGRADKGLFITTGTFTREAIKEATRDGAPPIDLIDGQALCDKLKEFKLGVETEQIESVTVIDSWFDNL